MVFFLRTTDISVSQIAERRRPWSEILGLFASGAGGYPYITFGCFLARNVYSNQTDEIECALKGRGKQTEVVGISPVTLNRNHAACVHVVEYPKRDTLVSIKRLWLHNRLACMTRSLTGYVMQVFLDIHRD